MDLKQIEKLIAAMEESRIKRLTLKKEGFEIEIERECQTHYPEHYAVSGHAPSYLPPPSAPPAHPPAETKHKNVVEHHAALDTKEKPKAGTFVTSPMVGTFYGAPSPDDPPFVKVGDSVNENTVVCIIEAMKVMNEVKAGIGGRIAEILMHSGDPVEFGTRMFRIDPA